MHCGAFVSANGVAHAHAHAQATGEAAAIVSGVSTAEDMLASSVIAVSEQAAKIGIKTGMLGSEALEKMRSSSKL